MKERLRKRRKASKIFIIQFASVAHEDSIPIELLRSIQTPPRITSQRTRGSGINPLALVPRHWRVVPKGFNSPEVVSSTFIWTELDLRVHEVDT